MDLVWTLGRVAQHFTEKIDEKLSNFGVKQLGLHHEIMVVKPKLAIILSVIMNFEVIIFEELQVLPRLLRQNLDRILYDFFVDQHISVGTGARSPLVSNKCATITVVLKVGGCENADPRVIIFSPDAIVLKDAVVVTYISRAAMNDDSFQFQFVEIFLLAVLCQFLELFSLLLIMR